MSNKSLIYIDRTEKIITTQESSIKTIYAILFNKLQFTKVNSHQQLRKDGEKCILTSEQH